MADPKLLVAQLRLLNDSPDAFGASEAEKHEIMRLSRKAAIACESIFDSVQRLAYSPLPLVAARIGQDHEIFATLCANEGSTSLSTLATSSDLDVRLLESILDYMGTQGMVRGEISGQYSATTLTHRLNLSFVSSAVTHFHDNCLPAFGALNQTISKLSVGRTAFQNGHHTDQDFYTWMHSHPPNQTAFHLFMEAQFATLPTWLSQFDFRAEASREAPSAKILFVDVGGGNGSQCAELRKAWPEMPGKVILQDKREVLKGALQVEGMEVMEHDFFTEQPVKGAFVYYFRQIIHNFDDEDCVQILKAHVSALGPQSLIVLDDKVLPDDIQNAPGAEYTTALSLAMKAMFDARERKRAHWENVVHRAGLQIREIRKFTDNDDSIVIVQKKATP